MNLFLCLPQARVAAAAGKVAAAEAQAAAATAALAEAGAVDAEPAETGAGAADEGVEDERAWELDFARPMKFRKRKLPTPLKPG
jgi:hypothetical protein